MELALVTPDTVRDLGAWLCAQTFPFHHATRVDAAWIERAVNTGFFWGDGVRAFAYSEEDALLALIRVFDLADPTPLVDLRVADAARGRGVGTRALNALTGWVFDTFPAIGRVGGYTRHDNVAMRRVFEKSGFALEAIHRRAWRTEGEPVDCVGYAVLREEHARRTERPGSAALPLQGSCLCGAIRYAIDAPLGPIVNCHCSMCRKATGAAFRPRASVAAKSFRWVAGEALVSRYASSSTDVRTFCSVCGATLVTYFSHRPEQIGVALGTLDGDPARRAEAHVWVGSKAPWFEITDALPQHLERKR